MSKSTKNGSRLKNAKRREEIREKRREVKQIIREERYDELDSEEMIEPVKEETFNSNSDR